MPPTKARSPSTTTILRCMRRNRLVRQPNSRVPGSKTCTRTPASMSAPMKAGDRSGEPKPSIVMSTFAPLRAAASSAACSSSPTLSSNRMKVSSSTSWRAAAMAWNTRGK